MTHGQIHAALAARKLSPEKAAEIVIEKQYAKGARTKRAFKPIVLVGMFVLACIASVLGIKINQSA